MTKRVIAFLMCAVMVFASVPASPVAQFIAWGIEAAAAEQSFRVSIAPLSVLQGKTGVLVPTAYDADGAVIESGVIYTWESADTSIATVSSDGTVTGVKEGETDIIVTASYGGSTVTYYRSVTVQGYKPVTSLTPSVTEAIVVTAGETVELGVTVLPTTATVKELSWTCSDTTVAEVISSGVDEDSSKAYAYIETKAKSQGTVTVTYKTTDGTEKTGSFTIVVKPQITSLTLPSSVVLTTSSTNYRIVPVIEPSNAGNQVLNWSSDQTGVCKVSSLGYLTPVAPGSCFITAKTTDGSNITKKTFVVVSDGTTSISLDKSSVSMKAEETVDLTATCVTPTFEYEDAVTWTSSNPNIAKVDSLGIVTAVGPGNAVITATTADGTGKTAVCSVSVTQPLKGITLPSEITCSLGGTATITPTFDPANASNKNVTWSSNDTSVAEISADGVVTGKKVGTAVITAVATDDDKTYTASCTVTVEIPPTNVKLSNTALTLKAGDSTNGSRTLSVTIEPSDATNKSVTWKTSNPDVATVDSNGKVTAVAGGTAIITCTTVSAGRVANCVVTVQQDETGVQILNTPASSLYVTQTHTLKAVVSPSTATYQDVEWSSSNPGVVYIDQNGNITARSQGSSVITATTTNKKLTATCVITVSAKTDVRGISLNRNAASVTNGSKVYLIATVTPSNASNKTVYWTSSNTSVAAVDSNGTVTAKSAGAVRITATTADGNYTAYCDITVTEPVKGINLNKSATSIGVGRAETLSAVISPSNATNKSVSWSSSDTSVATVDSNGKVTAVKAGTTVITAVTKDGGYSDECTVTVVIPVSGVKINASSVTVPKGETRSVTKTISPSNASNQEVTWLSSNTSVATVSATGLIKGVRTGTATITVTTKDGAYQAHLDITVIQPVTSVSLTYSSISLDAGKKKTLEATVRPLTASDKTVKWTTNNKNVATVSAKGVVTAVAAGTATITCTSTDGYSSTTCKVTVTQPPTSIKFSSKTATVKIGTPKTLTPTVLPATASNKNVTWKSADEKIAKVSSDGVVTGIKKGKVKITATTSNGLYSATITVNVKKPVKSVSLNKTSITIAVGKTTTITATVKPKSASNKNVTWKSSDNDVLTVSKTGKITAKSAGYAVVTCTTKDGKKTAECTVFVNQPVKSLKLNKKSVTIDIDQKLTLKATVKPSTSSNKALKWTTSNKKVVKVTSKGVLKPVSTGTATVTVMSLDGGFKATCKVTVVKKVKSVSLPETLTVFLGEKGKLTAALTPSKPTNSKVTWKSGNKKVATVKNGVITPKKLGTTTITVTTADGGLTDTCKVTVKRAIKSLSLKKKNVTLNTGASFTLKVNKKPKNATETITWTTSNKNVATVSAKGVITAVGRGTATVTGTTEKGLKVQCKVTVKQPVTSMYISRTSAEVYIGDSLSLAANVLPKNANNQSYSWSSSNAAVATVAGGTVTPKSVGTAVITAKSANGKTAACTVTVKQHVTSITLDKSNVTLTTGEAYSLKTTVLPSNATEKGYTFVSSDKSVAAVSASGVITAAAPGTATITVRSNENNKTASCKVTVIQKVNTVAINSTAETLYVDKDYVGETFLLEATVSPSNASNKAVTWQSSNPNVASVSADGLVTAKKSGVSVITVTTVDGSKTARCTITVLQRVSGVTLEESLTINKGAEYRLTATVLPSDAYNKNIIWVPENEEIAKISEYGVVTGVAVGTTVITATTVDGSFKASCTVKVNEPVTGVSLDMNEMPALYKGQTQALTATVFPDFIPDENMNKAVTWSTSDSSVATVQDGVVTAVGKGEAVITVTTVDGSFTDTCTVNCLIPVEGITTDKEEYYIPVGSECNITATVLPEDASYPDLQWTIISGGEYFTLDNEGKVTANARGNGVVRITSVDNPEVEKDVYIHIVKKVEGVSLDITSMTLYKGKTSALSATVTPSDAHEKSVIWTSSDENIVTVDENGNVTAVGKGIATVTATTVDGGYTAECTFTVKQLVEEITLPEGEYNVGLGKNITLTATVLPDSADDKSLDWESSNSSVATVTDGVVTGLSIGETQITARATDSGEITATVKVTVTQHAQEITVESTADTLWIGESAVLTATVTPDDTTDKTVTWTSSDENIATVDENGKVTAVGADSTGETSVVITAESACKSVKSEYAITVKQQVTSIEFGEETVILKLGDTYTLEPTVLPENAYDKTLTYTSADKAVAEIDEKGTITAVGTGTVTVTAKSACGKAEKQCSVKVIVLPDGIDMETSISLEKTKTYPLEATLTPDNVTETEITFSSSDETVAAVDENGLVTALKAGTAIITAQTQVEGLYAQCEVTVFVNSEKINLNCTEHTFYVGEELELTAQLLPEDTTNKTITFTSSDKSVATVDENGRVTAVDAGTAKIIATAEDTGITAICTVTVEKHVEQISFPEDEIVAYAGRALKLNIDIVPSNATNKNIIWKVSDTRNAAIDSDGTLTALKEGTVIVTAESEDGGHKAICFVEIKTGIESVALDNTSILMDKGTSQTLTFTVTPENASEKKVIWTSSDETVATVDSNGVVTATEKSGEAVIRATAVDNSEAYGECTVRVKEPLVDIFFAESTISLRKGETQSLTVVYYPLDATVKDAVFTSSDDNIVTVDNSGKVTAVSSGEATVTVTAADGGHTAECVVKVYLEIEEIMATDFTINKGTVTDAPIDVSPANHDETLIYSSSDESVATIDEKGVITAKATGVTSITVTGSISGTSHTFTVTVKQPVTGVEFIKDAESVTKGEYTSVDYSILPADADNIISTAFTSSDESVAKIIDNSDGTVQGLRAGTSVIIVTVTTPDGVYSDSYTLTVADSE